MKIANKYNLYVIEDTAQALGAIYKGKKVGSIGHVGTLSFYPTKTITTGEGGAIVTNIEEIAKKIELLRNHGQTSRYFYDELGYNYRMTEFQAALGYSQLKRIEEIISRKERIAKILIEELEIINNDLIYLPKLKPYIRHAWHIFQIILNIDKIKVSRDKIVNELRQKGLECISIVYPYPLTETNLFKYLKGHGRGCPWNCPFYGKKIQYKDLPNTKWVCERIISILLSPLYSDDDVIYMAKTIIKTLREYS